MPSITNLSKCQDKLTDRYEDKLIEFIKWISSCEKKCIKDMCDKWVPYICKIFPEQCEDLKKEVGLEEFCEEFIVDKRTEKEKNIENKCHNLLKNLCKTPSKECEDLQKMCKEKLRQDTCKEIQKNILQKFFKPQLWIRK